MMLGTDGRARIAPDIFARPLEGDLIILDLGGGDYWKLDPLGARLWEALSLGRSPREAAAEILGAYDVDEATLLRDLVALADELVRRKLIVPLGAGEAP